MDAGIIGVLGTILGVLIAGPVTYYFSSELVKKTHINAIDLIEQQEILRAASKFKAGIIYELTGFFPINFYWEEKDFPRLYQILPKIKSICAEFRCFAKCKVDFDTAVKEYDEYCRKITWDEYHAYTMFPTMRKEGEISPREKFEHLVNNLLSFAEKK